MTSRRWDRPELSSNYPETESTIGLVAYPGLGIHPTRAVIADDQPHSRHLLRTLLEQEEGIEIVAEASTGPEAVERVREEVPDLLFLEVEIPELDGFEVMRALKQDLPPAMILVNAQDRYAIRAFQIHALDYLLKPFDGERVHRALGHVRSRLCREEDGGAPRRTLALLQQLAARHRPPCRLVVRSPERTFFLRTETIDWIEAAGKFVHLHVGRAVHALRESMAELEQELDPARFLRISRSVIVNLDRIQEVQPWFQGDYVLILADGTRLTSTRGYRENLHHLLGR